MCTEKITEIRKLSQKYAYASLQMHETIARKAGFSATDHKYLGFFLQKGSLTAGELASLTGLTSGAVTGLINRFERKKLVKRVHDHHDGRKVIIEPDRTKIMALMTPFYQTFQQESENIIASFSEAEMEILKAYFLKALALTQETYNQFK
ncbi:MAG: winged helix-turn-helix transcriptional regulator [Candidatus Sericytochromatia bacterium]|nr:winged helix-turn-helix transcriptional regulator [Candidatus Sericytochromatia bacterium]